MKILLVNKYWYHRGGAERVVFLTKQLLEEHGHRVDIFGMHHPANEINNRYFIDYVDFYEPQWLQKIRAAGATIYNAEAKQRFAELLDDIHPDVIHVHNIYHQLSFSLLEAAKERGIRVVMTLHDYKMLSPNYTLFHHNAVDTSMLGKKYYRCLLSNCMESFPLSLIATVEAYYRKIKRYDEYVDAYIAPSQFIKNLCVQAGWSADRIRVIPNPVDITPASRSVSEETFVSYIGRLSFEKGVHVLLEAAKLTPHIPYHIIGEGKERASLEAYVAKEHLQNVSFLGWQSQNALVGHIQSSRLIVAPSLWYENCPLSILEAMAAKKVVIGSDIGGIPELLPPELLVPAGDPTALAERITTWYNSPSKERAAVGTALRQRVATQHTRAGYYDALLDIYR